MSRYDYMMKRSKGEASVLQLPTVTTGCEGRHHQQKQFKYISYVIDTT